MKNTNIVKTKSPPGLKTIQTKNIFSNRPASAFIRMIHSIRLMKNQRHVASRQALAKRQLSGFSKHILEDIGVMGDVFQNGDITNSCKSFIDKLSINNGDTTSQLQANCSKTTFRYIDFSNEEIALKKVA